MPLALSAQVAHYAYQKRLGYWQTVHYLAQVERQHGAGAALMELELFVQMDAAVRRAEKKGLEKVRHRKR